MTFSVTKANGYKQPFDRAKVVQTCLRMGSTPQIANQIADKVENKLYEGISTREILQMIFRYMRKHKPEIKNLFDLKKGISIMESKPEFELYVQKLLTYIGYEVGPSRILRGKCGEHEVDAIAKKDEITYFVEAKHHSSYHSLTGLDESRIAYAILEDANEGYLEGSIDLKVDRAMIVTNTRYSDHAIKYGTCKNILQVGWSMLQTPGLRDIIKDYNMYPLSCLKELQKETRRKMVNAGIVLIGELLESDNEELSRKTGIPQHIIIKIKQKAQINTITHSGKNNAK